MSESYTIGGDTLHGIDRPHRAGQTFRPKEAHILEFVDLEMRGAMYYNDPVIQIFHADAHHRPYEPCLSRDLWIVEKKSSLFGIGRVRFKMQPLLVIPAEYYCITAANFPPLLGNPASWQYDAGDASYPGGIRVSSADSGETWTQHYNDDHIFAEFGDPPLPAPAPPPPIDNFAVLDLNQLHLDNAIIFRLNTSVPCHLTLYWTPTKPLTHHQSRILRGLPVPWRTYFCFVNWHTIEQTEPGDTLYHTFVAPDWLPSQVRWFTIRGEVDFELSPSVGPIFKHTHPGQDLIANPSFEVFTNPPNPPDSWAGGGPPGQPAIFNPDQSTKTDGLQSCKATVTRWLSLQRLYQYLSPSLLSDLQLAFRVSYNGALEWRNTMRVRAWGDTFALQLARPAFDYQWEDLTLTITMPSNLYQLQLDLTIDNQGQPVPWHAWWDFCRVYLAPPP